jgi:HSP20 family protein
MKEGFVFDMGRIFDDMFNAARDFKQGFKEGFSCWGPGREHRFHWDENVDFYPLYPYPPCNVYLTEDKKLIFEFAMAGFEEKNIDLQFKGDYMILQAKTDAEQEPQNVRYFKRRLKFKDITDQKYYVPENKFDRDKVKAVFKNGVLRVVIPPKEDYTAEQGVKIDIVSEE